MTNVLIVARKHLREAVRDRVLYKPAAFRVADDRFGSGGWADLNGHRVDRDGQHGLSAISLIGLLIAVFTGVGLVSKEIDKRTLHACWQNPCAAGNSCWENDSKSRRWC